MAVRKNGYYADPALGTAFDNLADAFKTPSGTDISGYATASATREKAARLSELYSYAKDPGYNQERADRMGVLGGLYSPNQSYYAVDENNDTSLKTNAATNAASLAVADKNNAGALARTYAAPVVLADGQSAFLPAQTQAATGLPSMFRGNVTTNPGQTVTTPNNEVIAGPAKPLTDSEMKAKILGELPKAEQRAVGLQGVGVSPVVVDGEPINVLTPDAAGKTPYKPDERNRQLGTYVLSDGKTKGEAFFNNDTNKWNDTQSGKEIPAGSTIARNPSTQVNIDTKAPSAIETAYGEGVGGQLKMTLDNAGAAPRNLAEIAQFRDALSRAGDNVTTGPLSSYALKGKQAIGGLLGTTLDGVPEAELINNIGFKLATQAVKAISSRPTQMEFGKALEIKPGLALSKPGMLATLSILEQNAKDDQALAVLANDPANRQNWTTTVQKYYAEHPVMSPFEPGKPLGATDIARLEAAAPASTPAPVTSATPAAGAKSATVTQNGHTYALQPDGSYK